MNNQAVIVAATRTPITRAIKGAFAHTRAEDLVVAAIEGALAHIPELDPHTIDDIITGSWMQSKDQGGNIARRIAVLLGYDGVPGVSVNRACASSLQAARPCQSQRSSQDSPDGGATRPPPFASSMAVPSHVHRRCEI